MFYFKLFLICMSLFWDNDLSFVKERLCFQLQSVTSRAVGSVYNKESAHCEPYVNRCIELCWLMTVQDPQLHLDFDAQNGDRVDESLFKHFTKSGEYIDYLVWPVLYLHSKGPLLKKGVVQAFSI